MASPKKKTKKANKPTAPQDNQFESLIQQAMRQVGPKKFHLDPAIYTEEYFRERLPAERRKANANLDYIPDYHHLKNLPIWDHTQMIGVLFGITWQGYLELVPQWPFGPAVFSEIVIPVRKKSDKFELEPEYQWSPEIKRWYLSAVEAIAKFEEILHRGTGHIPGVVWKDKAYFFTIKDFIPWLMKELKIIEWLQNERCRIPEGLENFLGHLGSAPETTPTTKKKTSVQGKQASPLKQEVINKALELRGRGHSSAPTIARHPAIVQIIAPDVPHANLADIEPDEYERRFKHKVGTVEDWIREGFLENPLP